jgi:hypothetical protein
LGVGYLTVEFEPQNVEQGMSNFEVLDSIGFPSSFDIPCSTFDIQKNEFGYDRCARLRVPRDAVSSEWKFQRITRNFISNDTVFVSRLVFVEPIAVVVSLESSQELQRVGGITVERGHVVSLSNWLLGGFAWLGLYRG